MFSVPHPPPSSLVERADASTCHFFSVATIGGRWGGAGVRITRFLKADATAASHTTDQRGLIYEHTHRHTDYYL